MRAFRTGQICVMASTGVAHLLHFESLQPLFEPKKLHNMPITACAMLTDDRLATASTDYTYKFTAISDFSVLNSAKKWAVQLGLLLLVLLVVADLLY